MIRLYLAGPMRGIPEFNFPAFDEAAARLREVGWEVCSPAEMDRAQGFDPAGMAGTDDELAAVGFDVRAALTADLDWICRHADGVALLDGWESSTGARAEHAAAVALGLPVRTVDQWIVVEAGR